MAGLQTRDVGELLDLQCVGELSGLHYLLMYLCHEVLAVDGLDKGVGECLATHMWVALGICIYAYFDRFVGLRMTTHAWAQLCLEEKLAAYTAIACALVERWAFVEVAVRMHCAFPSHANPGTTALAALFGYRRMWVAQKVAVEMLFGNCALSMAATPCLLFCTWIQAAVSLVAIGNVGLQTMCIGVVLDLHSVCAEAGTHYVRAYVRWDVLVWGGWHTGAGG